MTRTELISTGKTVERKDLTKCLKDLEQCGFIRRFSDFSSEKNGGHFQLTDPLCLFYLSFLDNKHTASWLDFHGTPGWYTWCGLAFEKVCIHHIPQIKQALGISGISSNVFSWKSKHSSPGAQIDMLIDRKDDVINLCEIKYSIDEFAIDQGYEKDLIRKQEALRRETKTKKAVWITMITFSGLKKNEYSSQVVCELCGDDLFL